MLQPTSTTQSFPLSALHLSALNVRQVTDPDAVKDLVASIRSTGGIVQNLVVTMEKRPRKKTTEPGVVAGGRRLAALQALLDAGEIGGDFEVPCTVVPLDRAIEISIAENDVREGLTPVQQFKAFATLAESGLPVEDIAARFGVPPIVVSRRLKLATVSPKLIELCETGGMTLEQLMAFTVVDDHERQEQCWKTAPHYERHADSLRARLLGGKLRADRDSRMKFVGLKAYKKAGGTLTHDLFATHDGYINDVELLDRLVAEKLTAKSNELTKEGWGSVVVSQDRLHDHELSRSHNRLEPQLRELTKPERDNYDGKKAALAKLETELDEIYEGSEDTDEAREKADELEKRKLALEREVDKLDDELRDYTAEQKAAGTAFVCIGHDGKAQIMRGYVARGVDAPGTTGMYGDEPAKAVRPTHSAKLVQMLTAERSLAMQALLLRDPSLALVAVLHRMADTLLGHSYGGDHAIKISVTSNTDTMMATVPEGVAPEAVDALKQAEARWEGAYATAREGGLSTFDWIVSLTPAERTELHAYFVAISFDARREIDHTATGDALTAYARLDMRQWWKPTAARYFLHVGRAQVIEALTEAGVPTEGLDKLKKAELAGKAEALIAHTGWLPGPLRA